MTVTYSSFRDRYPEFARAEQKVVEACIAEAKRSVNDTVWLDRTDDGVNALAAHLIAMGPGGLNARLDPKLIRASEAKEYAATTYGLRYFQLKESIAIGPMAIV